MNKRLIINADDFGLSPDINAAVIKAHKEGVVTSATVMANMAGAVEACKMARQNRGLGVGVHLNVTMGKPLSKEKAVRCLLNENGEFAFAPGQLAWMSLYSGKIRHAIQVEMACQIQWVLDRNIKVSHVDSHHHIHCCPMIYPTVCGLAKLFDVEAVRWVYEPQAVSSVPWPLPSEGAKKHAKLLRRAAQINRFQNSKLIKTDGLLGIAHFGNINFNFFKDLSLYNPLATAELMTHPGYSGPASGDYSQFATQRQSELETLCSDKTKEYLAKANIELVHYGQV
jgi:chitin disaccharide deacetylase